MNDIDSVAIALRDATESYRKATKAFHKVARRLQLRLDRRAALRMLDKAPRLFLGYCALMRTLKGVPQFVGRTSSVVVIMIPKAWSLDDMEFLAGVCFGLEEKNLHILNVVSHPTARNKKGQWEITPHVQLGYQKVLILAQAGAELHPEFEAAADAIVFLDAAVDRDLIALSRLLETGVIDDDDKEFARQQQSTALDAVFRQGRPSSVQVARLRNIVTKRERSVKLLPISAFGEAAIWANHLRDDLKAWQSGTLAWADVDKGVLVYGPPGTGKTAFAVSVAGHLGIPLVSGSLAQWQSAGHLGDLLRVMYDAFNQAKSSVPSILFIDEIDAVGDRRKFSGDNAQYCTEVVNALLEALDGTMGREGVVVMAASNFRDRIDPALLRSGRLEHHIELPRPSASARADIIRYYLPDVTSEAVKVAAARLREATGADIEYFARRVRRHARAERRPVATSDLLRELPDDISLSDVDLWRVCVHEAGHAVLARLYDIGTIKAAEIFAGDALNSGTGDAHGRVTIDFAASLLKSETSLRNEIAMQLGGMLAEELFIGDKSTTAGGTDQSDLAGATDLALKMTAVFGMGRTVRVVRGHHVDLTDEHLFERNPGLEQDVDDLLETEYIRARRVLLDHQSVVLSFAAALKAEGRVSGERLDELLSPLAKPPLPELSTIKL